MAGRSTRPREGTTPGRRGAVAIEELALKFTAYDAISQLATKIGDSIASLTGRMRTEGEAQAGMWGKIGAAGAAAAVALAAVVGASVAIGVGAVKAADDFNSQMMLVRTQAHDTSDSIDWLSQQVLALAPTVGIGPDQLAEGLYHVTSVGYTGAQAIQILKVAAEGAKVGMANLDDTAYALTSTMNTFGLKGDQAYATMATLNAIVGAGDMKFQDLNGAISTGFLAAGETFGVSIQSMGAALAYLTDRGASADEAATRLKMSITLLGAPSKQASGILKDLGLSQEEVGQRTSAMEEALRKSGVTTTQLSNDLRSPDGIQVALQDLVSHMQAAGLSADETAAVLSRAFGGGRSGAAIMSMVQHLDTLQTKFNTINSGQARFGSDFADTMSTLNSRVDQVRAGFEAWRIELGEYLMPVASALLGWFAAQMPVIESAASRITSVIGSIVTRTTSASRGAGATGATVGFLEAIGVNSDTAIQVGAAVGTITQNIQSASTQIVPLLRTIGSTVRDEVVPALQSAVPIVLGMAEAITGALGPALDFADQHSWLVVGALKAITAILLIGWARDTASAAVGAFQDIAAGAQGGAKAVATAWNGLQELGIWAQLYAEAALSWVQTTASAVAESVKTAAAWVAAQARAAAGWVAAQVRAAATFVATTASSVAEAAKSAAAWLAAQARIVAGWIATAARAVASYVATAAAANPNSNAAVIVWTAGQLRIAAGWVATQARAIASFVATAAAATVNAIRVGLAWVGAQAQAIASFVATTASAAAESATTLAVWAAAQASVVGGWVAAQVATIATFVATAAASVAQTGIMIARFALAQGAMLAIRAATLLWTAAQWALDLALDANPIGLVIIAIAALIAGVIWAYQNVGWFRDAVDTAWDGIKRFAEWIWSGLKPILDWLGETIGKIAGALGNLASAAGSVLGAAGAGLSAAGFAGGGIVTRPTLAVVGEAGPEMIVPLSTINQGASAIPLAPALASSSSLSGQAPTVVLHTHIQLGNEEFAVLVQRIQDARLSRLLTAT